MQSSDPLSLRTLTFCAIAFAQKLHNSKHTTPVSFIAPIARKRKRFCTVSYIRGMACALTHTNKRLIITIRRSRFRAVPYKTRTICALACIRRTTPNAAGQQNLRR